MQVMLPVAKRKENRKLNDDSKLGVEELSLLKANFNEGNPENAKAEIDAYLKSYPKNPAGYLLRAIYHGMAGRYESAGADFEKAKSMTELSMRELLNSLQINDLRVFHKLFLISKYIGKNDEAVEWLGEAYRLLPNPESLQLLLKFAGSTGAGTTYLDELFPVSDPSKRWLLAEGWISIENYMRAIQVLQGLEKIEGSDFDRNNILKAVAYLKMNRVDDAAACAGQVRQGSAYKEIAKSIETFWLLLNGEAERAQEFMAGLKPCEYLRVAQFFLEECGRVAGEGQVKFPGHKEFDVFLKCFKV